MAEAPKINRKKSESRKRTQAKSNNQGGDTKPNIKFDVEARNFSDSPAAIEHEKEALAHDEEINSQGEPVINAQLILEQTESTSIEPTTLTKDCPLTTKSEFDSISENSCSTLDDSMVHATNETDNQEKTPKQPTNGCTTVNMTEAPVIKRKKSESEKRAQAKPNNQDCDTKPNIKFDVKARNFSDSPAAIEHEKEVLAQNEEVNNQSEPVANAQLINFLEQPESTSIEPTSLTKDYPLTTKSEFDSISENSCSTLDDSMVHATNETDNQEKTSKQLTKGATQLPTADELFHETKVYEEQQNAEFDELDFDDLGDYFGNLTVERLPIHFDFTQAERSDIELSIEKKGVKAAAVKALTTWHKLNPSKATPRKLVDFALRMRNGELARNICLFAANKVVSNSEVLLEDIKAKANANKCLSIGMVMPFDSVSSSSFSDVENGYQSDTSSFTDRTEECQHVNMYELVKHRSKLTKSEHSTKMIAIMEESTKKIRNIAFAKLIHVLTCSLERNLVSIQKIVLYLAQREELEPVFTSVESHVILKFDKQTIEDFKTCSNSGDFLLMLQGYYSWINYHMIEDISNEFCSFDENLKDAFEYYKGELVKYCKKRLEYLPHSEVASSSTMTSKQHCVFYIDKEWIRMRVNQEKPVIYSIRKLLHLQNEIVLHLRAARDHPQNIPINVTLFPTTDSQVVVLLEQGKEDCGTTRLSSTVVERKASLYLIKPDLIFSETLIQFTKKCDTCNILAHVYSEDYNESENTLHLELLSGIIGEYLPADNSTYSIRKNGVTVTIHFDSLDDCNVTFKDVDLFLFFLPVVRDALHESYSDKIKYITKRRGESIWSNSVIILTGVDATLDRYGHNLRGNTKSSIEELLGMWKQNLQQAANSTTFQILPAGRQDQPNLPEPYENWFSHLWFSSFRALNVRAMPAMLKFAQNRVSNSIASRDIQCLPFYQQPIEIKEGEVTLPMSAKLGLGIGGGGAIAGATAAGATTGALIGAIVIGIPSFGIAAFLGLLTGGVVGGSIGVGVASAAVGGAYHMAKNLQQQEIWVRNQKLYYVELLTRIPKISNHLNQWARRQTTCKIVVAGIKQEGVSTAAAAIAGCNPLYTNDYYEYQSHERARLVVRDFKSFCQDTDRDANAKQLGKLMRSNDLLVFCVPMTSSKENFVRSSNATYLQRLCALDKNILSHTVIALTHANEMQRVVEGKNEQPQISFQQFFNDEVEAWKTQIRSVLRGCNQSDNFDINGVPIIPVGASELSIDLSDNDPSTPATHYYWLSQFLINAMSATKPEGLPALIRINKRQVQQQPNEYPDIDTVFELITEAQCSMFSKIGLKEKKDPGEIIGVIMGMNDEQNW